MWSIAHKENSSTTWICTDKGGKMDSTGYRLGGDRYAQTKIKERRLIYLVIRSRGSKGWKARMGRVRVIEKWGLWEIVAFFLLCPFLSFLLLFKDESFITYFFSSFFFFFSVEARLYRLYLHATSLSLSHTLPLTHISPSEMKRRGIGVLALLWGKHNVSEQGVFCLCVCACVCERDTRIALEAAFLAFD